MHINDWLHCSIIVVLYPGSVSSELIFSEAITWKIEMEVIKMDLLKISPVMWI
jgi:hypothetical protein